VAQLIIQAFYNPSPSGGIEVCRSLDFTSDRLTVCESEQDVHLMSQHQLLVTHLRWDVLHDYFCLLSDAMISAVNAPPRGN
jgi:hypothetical protein